MISQEKIKDILSNKLTWIFLFVVGLIFKTILLPTRTGDYIGFLQPWIDFIQSHGYFRALKYNFYNYTPSYIYILVLIAKTGLNPLYMVKIVSILFEYLAAFFIGKIAFLKTKNITVLWLSLVVIPLLPTVLLNSSYLSQCDSIYASFVFGSIYYLLKERKLISVVLLGLAFAFKMQAIIMLPFFFVMMLRGKINWYYFLVVPVVFLISLLPAWFIGRPINELLTVYISQSNHYEFLSLNFPNLYIFIDNKFYETGKLIGITFTFFFTVLFGRYLSQKEYVYTFDNLVQLAFLSSIVIPFILPGMHERYMYMGDILGILYFLVLRKKVYLPVGILLVSFYSYIRCSRFNDMLPMWPAFAVYLAVIILLIVDFYNDLRFRTKNAEE